MRDDRQWDLTANLWRRKADGAVMRVVAVERVNLQGGLDDYVSFQRYTDDPMRGSTAVPIGRFLSDFEAATGPHARLPPCVLCAELRAALQDLYDEQNGPPLIRRQEQWEAAMERASRLLNPERAWPQEGGGE